MHLPVCLYPDIAVVLSKVPESKTAVFRFGSWSKPLFNHLLGASLRASSAMETPVLVDDHRLFRDVDALLRAEVIAQFAADEPSPT